MKILIKSPCNASTIIKYGIKNWPVREYDEQRNFHCKYKEKETCLIIEGQATIKSSSQIYIIKSGDLVIFPVGFDCIWEIDKSIKKHYRIGD